MVNVYSETIIKPLYDALDEEHQYYARNLHKLYTQYILRDRYRLTNPGIVELLKDKTKLKDLFLKRIKSLEYNGKRLPCLT